MKVEGIELETFGRQMIEGFTGIIRSLVFVLVDIGN
jgi:hypothetical protein